MKRPPVGVNDSIIEFIASDDRDTMDEWLATLHREPCPPGRAASRSGRADR